MTKKRILRCHHDSEVAGSPSSLLCDQSRWPGGGAGGQSPGPEWSVIEQFARGPGLSHLEQAQPGDGLLVSV